MEDPGPSVSQQSLVQVSESRGEVEASTSSTSPQSGPVSDSCFTCSVIELINCIQAIFDFSKIISYKSCPVL